VDPLVDPLPPDIPGQCCPFIGPVLDVEPVLEVEPVVALSE
jgi:hypothetical protein